MRNARSLKLMYKSYCHLVHGVQASRLDVLNRVHLWHKCTTQHLRELHDSAMLRLFPDLYVYNHQQVVRHLQHERMASTQVQHELAARLESVQSEASFEGKERNRLEKKLEQVWTTSGGHFKVALDEQECTLQARITDLVQMLEEKETDLAEVLEEKESEAVSASDKEIESATRVQELQSAVETLATQLAESEENNALLSSDLVQNGGKAEELQANRILQQELQSELNLMLKLVAEREDTNQKLQGDLKQAAAFADEQSQILWEETQKREEADELLRQFERNRILFEDIQAKEHESTREEIADLEKQMGGERAANRQLQRQLEAVLSGKSSLKGELELAALKTHEQSRIASEEKEAREKQDSKLQNLQRRLIQLQQVVEDQEEAYRQLQRQLQQAAIKGGEQSRVLSQEMDARAELQARIDKCEPQRAALQHQVVDLEDSLSTAVEECILQQKELDEQRQMIDDETQVRIQLEASLFRTTGRLLEFENTIPNSVGLALLRWKDKVAEEHLAMELVEVQLALEDQMRCREQAVATRMFALQSQRQLIMMTLRSVIVWKMQSANAFEIEESWADIMEVNMLTQQRMGAQHLLWTTRRQAHVQMTAALQTWRINKAVATRRKLIPPKRSSQFPLLKLPAHALARVCDAAGHSTRLVIAQICKTTAETIKQLATRWQDPLFVMSTATNGLLLLERYDHSKYAAQQWKPLDTTVLQPFCGGTVFGKRVYFCGGGRAGSPWEACRLLPTRRVVSTPVENANSSWNVAPSMLTARVACSVVAVGGVLMVAGGVGRSGLMLASNEIFNLQKNCWEHAAPLANARAGSCAVVVGDTVYMIGGFCNSTRPQSLSSNNTAHDLRSVEIYHHKTGKWEFGPSLMHPRSEFAACVFANYLFVMGGSTRVVEALDLSNLKTGWCEVGLMGWVHHRCGVAMLDGELHVIGGVDCNHTPVESEKCRLTNPKQLNWEMAPTFGQFGPCLSFTETIDAPAAKQNSTHFPWKEGTKSPSKSPSKSPPAANKLNNNNILGPEGQNPGWFPGSPKSTQGAHDSKNSGWFRGQPQSTQGAHEKNRFGYSNIGGVRK